MTSSSADEQQHQTAWQRRAHAVLGDLLSLAARDGLPVLSWTISDAGAAITGRSHSGARGGPAAARADIAAWAGPLGIGLREQRVTPWRTTVTGVAEQRETRHGACTIVLAADLPEDEPGIREGGGGGG